MTKPWTEAELRLLGTKPDFDLGREIGRAGKAVWAKRRALGITAPPAVVRLWTRAEDDVIRSESVSAAAKTLKRTEMAVRIRRRKLGLGQQPRPNSNLMNCEDARRRIEVGRYESQEQEEKVKFVGGPFVPIGGHLAGIADDGTPIPWPTGEAPLFTSIPILGYCCLFWLAACGAYALRFTNIRSFRGRGWRGAE